MAGRTSLWFLVPVHGRQALTEVCLRQLARTCEAAGRYGIDATAVVIGAGSSVELAAKLGFATVRRDNSYLGRRFNDGYQLACDPEFNPSPADYVVPCGSDDWVDPVVFQRLPPPDAIGTFSRMATVNEDRTLLSLLKIPYRGGAGIRVIPRQLIAEAGYRPADEDRKRAIDTSTLMGISAARERQPPPMVSLDVHSLQIVDWKTRGQQLNSYQMLAGMRDGPEQPDPYQLLGGHYPAAALEEMRALDRTWVAA